MERKEFIKRFTGIDLKTLFEWAGILLLVFILFSVNLTSLPGTVFSILKPGGFLILMFFAAVVAVIVINIFLKQLSKLLPGNLILWFRKHGQKILWALVILVFSYIVYDSIKKEKYFLLLFMLVYFGFSYLFRNNEKTDKRSNPI